MFRHASTISKQLWQHVAKSPGGVQSFNLIIDYFLLYCSFRFPVPVKVAIDG